MMALYQVNFNKLAAMASLDIFDRKSDIWQHVSDLKEVCNETYRRI